MWVSFTSLECEQMELPPSPRGWEFAVMTLLKEHVVNSWVH